MSLIGLPLFVLLIAICVLINIQRFGLLALAQLMVVTTTFIGINHSMVFYATWRDLFGNYAAYNNPITQIQIETKSPLDTYIRSTRAGAGFHSNGGIFSFVLTGAKSGVTAPVYIYLPPTYGADVKKKWPVLVLLPGYPGVPTTWFHALDLIHIIRHEVSTGFAHDFVLVLPTLSVVPPRDTECTDIPGGPQVNTWLGVDVPKAMIAGLSVSENRKDWAITGYSTGGFCAAKVMLSHSERFSVSIPIAAYFAPFKGKLTGNLFGGSQAIKDANSPLLLAKALKLPSHMLLVGSSQDPGVMADIASMEKVANPNLVIDQLVDQHGGHTTKVWKSQLPRILDWLSAKIPHI
jgi:hypothetical protein